MQRLAVLMVMLLTGYTAGTVVVSTAEPETVSVGGILSPFLLIALGILLASLGYAISSVAKAVRKERHRP